MNLKVWENRIAFTQFARVFPGLKLHVSTYFQKTKQQTGCDFKITFETNKLLEKSAYKHERMYKLMGFCIAKSISIPPPNLVIRNVEIIDSRKVIIDCHTFASMPNYRRKITPLEDYFYRSNLKIILEDGMSIKTDFKLKKEILKVLNGEWRNRKENIPPTIVKQMTDILTDNNTDEEKNNTLNCNDEILLIEVSAYNDNTWNANYEHIERIVHTKNIAIYLHKTRNPEFSIVSFGVDIVTFTFYGAMQYVTIIFCFVCFIFVFAKTQHARHSYKI